MSTSIEDLINENKKLHENRLKYMSEYTEFENNKVKQEKQKDLYSYEYIKNKPLSKDELIHIFSETVKTSKNEQEQDIKINQEFMMYRLMQYAHTKQYVKPTPDKDEINNTRLTIDKSYNYVINKLEELKIDVYDVIITPERYLGRSYPCLARDTSTFIFYCGKDKYNFRLTFYDDSDCFPGILQIKEIIHKQTKQQYNIRGCDLFCQNTPEDFLVGLLEYIKFDNPKDFKYARDAECKAFINKLSEYFVVTGSSISSPPVNSTINENKENHKTYINLPFNHYIDVKRNESECRIQITKYAPDEYLLIVGKKLEDSFIFKYKNHTDDNDLVACINRQIDLMNGTWGYYDSKSKIWFNTHNSFRYLDTKSDSNSISIAWNVNNYFGNYQSNVSELDLNIEITIGHDSAPLTYQEHKYSTTYCVEFYTCRFQYDKIKNMVTLTITGKYRPLTFVNDYYDNEKEFMKNPPAYLESIGSYEMIGDFSTMYTTLHSFIERLIEQGNSEKLNTM